MTAKNSDSSRVLEDVEILLPLVYIQSTTDSSDFFVDLSKPLPLIFIEWAACKKPEDFQPAYVAGGNWEPCLLGLKFPKT